MPTLFLSPELEVLDQDWQTLEITLSRRHVACLVVHQFLCTYEMPSWMTDGCPDFHIWYSSETPHPKAVEAYLFGLFRYLELLSSPVFSPLRHDIFQWPIIFTLRALSGDWLVETDVSKPLSPFNVLNAEQQSSFESYDSLLGIPKGVAVISANKDVGFGRTASQEEMFVGASPELCVAVLLMPTLKEGEVLLVQGAQAFVAIDGYARDAHLSSLLDLDGRQGDPELIKWRNRTVLFMDALELDSYDSKKITADLLSGNVDRELKKAYTAFSAGSNEKGFDVVVTGLWACRSFGGNREIKAVIQWLAASMADTKLRFICTGKDQEYFAACLQKFIACGNERAWRSRNVLNVLRDLDPESEDAKHVFAVLQDTLHV